MATTFLVYVAVMAVIVVVLVGHYLSRRAALCVLSALCVWFAYVGLLGYFGIIQNSAMRPPGITFILLPVVVFLVVVVLCAWRAAGGRVALAFPLWVILGIQGFRVGIELFLHQLWIDGLIPKMLTFEGANVDIYIGATAPLIAWLSMRGRTGMKFALAWNVLGLLALANVVTRAILTTPGSLNLIHAEVPNRMFGIFPFMFIPGFFVPLAVTLHVIAIRAITGRLRSEIMPPAESMCRTVRVPGDE